jgi:hypothetical protein
MRITQGTVVGLALVGLLAGQRAYASDPSCLPVLQAHADWVHSQQDGPGFPYLEFTYASNSPSVSNSSLKVTYAEGTLTYQEVELPVENTTITIATFTGAGTVYSSIDHLGSQCLPNCPSPFDPKQAKPVSVTLLFNGQALVRVGSGATKTIDLVCDTDGTLHGPVDGSASPTQYIFSLRRLLFVPPPTGL